MNPKRMLHPKRTGKNASDNGSKWLSPKKRQAIYQRDNYQCVYCGLSQLVRQDPQEWTVDHLLPTELGGTDQARNLATACKSCNSAKGKKTVKQFLKWLQEKMTLDPEMVRSRIRRCINRKLPPYREVATYPGGVGKKILDK